MHSRSPMKRRHSYSRESLDKNRVIYHLRRPIMNKYALDLSREELVGGHPTKKEAYSSMIVNLRRHKLFRLLQDSLLV